MHCVHNGVIEGTVHLSAKVVRNLYESFNVDCIASAKTYEQLVGKKPPDDPPDNLEDDDEQQEEAAKYKKNPDEPKNAVRKRLHRKPSSWNSNDSSSSDSLEEYHAPVNKKWLFDASLIAEVAQNDPSDILLELENEKSIPKLDGSFSDNPGGEDDSTADNHDEEDDSNSNNPPNAIANEEDVAKTDDEDESIEDERHCDLCFNEGKPIRIVTNHNERCPTCLIDILHSTACVIALYKIIEAALIK